ncbi:CHASE2 domain-containing protein [Paraburkholderia sediminicola]|uniref:CHASE2 domain-containing protein n=1 Tax=Paraburkholderia sediminicola TaxID=458836 RepID=UPI0038BC7CEE
MSSVNTGDGQNATHPPLGYGKVIAATVVLMALQAWIGHTYSGQFLEIKSYSYLERLLPDTTLKRLPVVVLDISHLPGGTDPANLLYDTPRNELLELLKALHKTQPIAIGLDIDFSPGENGIVEGNRDFEFFEQVVNLGTPVFFGVSRMNQEGSAAWLGVPAYASMAANVTGVKSPVDKRVLLRVIKELPQKTGRKNLPSMGEALASVYRRDFPNDAPTPPLPGLLLENDTERGYLVNYSKVGQLARERSAASTPAAILGTSADFAQKMVILGDLSQYRMTTDYFVLPTGEEQNGVLFQASTAYTFASEPLYEFVTPVRILLDLALTLPFLVAVRVQNAMRAKATTNLDTREKFVEFGALIVALILSFGVGGFFILKWRILWLEAVLAGIALILHGVFGDQLHTLWNLSWVKTAREAVVHRVRTRFGRTTI